MTTRRLRVVLFSRFPEDMSHPKGGVESATVGLVRGLCRRNDAEVHVVTLERTVERPRTQAYPGFVVHRLPRGRWPMIADVFVGPGRRLVDRYVRSLQPDVVHFQETYGFGARSYDAPVVFTVHGFDSLNLRTEKRALWRLRAPLWRIAEKVGIRPHRCLVSIAKYVTDELRPLTDAQIVEIPNAIDAGFFARNRAEVPGRVLFAGWLNQRKNLLDAVRAVHALVRRGIPVELHAAGAPVDPSYVRRVEEYVAEHGLHEHVRLLGRISQEQIRREMNEACALVLPSFQENAPMVIAEALATGLPVVATNACGIPDMVQEGVTGFLIDPRDIEQTSERLERILTDGELRATMSVAGASVAERTWHPAAVAEATMQLYRRLCDPANAPEHATMAAAHTQSGIAK